MHISYSGIPVIVLTLIHSLISCLPLFNTYFIWFFLHYFYHRDSADDFIAAHRLSNMLVKINLEDSAVRNQDSVLGLLPTEMGSVHERPTELGTGKSSGFLDLVKDIYNTKLQISPQPNNLLIHPGFPGFISHFSIQLT